METIFATVCAAILAGDINVSDNLGLACYKGETPAITNSGDFTNRGAGAELNFIIANADAFGLDIATATAATTANTDADS